MKVKIYRVSYQKEITQNSLHVGVFFQASSRGRPAVSQTLKMNSNDVGDTLASALCRAAAGCNYSGRA